MNTRSRSAGFAWMVMLMTLLALGLPGTGGAARAGDIAVIVHPDLDVDELSFGELRKIMLGDRQFWPSGQKVNLIVAEPVDSGRTVLLSAVYKMSEQQFRQFWISRVFRGEAPEGPRTVISSEGVIEMVGVLAGAIAFVDSEDVPAGVKVLKVDGMLPGEPGYSLGM